MTTYLFCVFSLDVFRHLLGVVEEEVAARVATPHHLPVDVLLHHDLVHVVAVPPLYVGLEVADQDAALRAPELVAPGPGLHPVDEPHVTVQDLDVFPAQTALVLGVVDGLQLLNWLRQGDILSAEILILHILIRFCREVVIFLRLYGLPPQQSSLLGNHVDVPLSLGQIALQVLVVPHVELGTALGVAEVAHGGRVGDVHVEELVVKVTVLVIVVIAVAIVLLIIVTFIFEVSIDFIYSCKK